MLCWSQAPEAAAQLFTKLSSGAAMPLLTFGTHYIKDAETMRTSLRQAILTGYRHIDAACAFGNEQLVGDSLKTEVFRRGLAKREELFITTKLFSTCHPRALVAGALKKQLKKLRLQYVDLYLIHFPVPYLWFPLDEERVHVDSSGRVLTDPGATLEETWQAMEDLVREGLTRSIGLSNCNTLQVARICQSGTIKPALNQIEIHPAFQNSSLVRFCKENGISVSAYLPFASPQGVMADMKLLENGVLKRIGAKYGKSPAQVILKWLVQREIAVVAKSITPRRIVENFDIWDFELDADDMESVAKLDANKRVMTVNVRGLKDHPEFPFLSS